MKNRTLKNIVSLLVFLTLGFSVFADDAVVTYVSGKVEVNRNNTWVQLKTGDKISESETISTGFNSEAKIKYGGSLMALGSLTRITLRQLSSTSTKENVDVYLNTGVVRSKVTHTDNTRVSYKVRSPVAVASVRGTIFDAYSDGEIICFEGAVATYPVSAEPKATAKKSDSSEESDAEETGSEETPGTEETSTTDNGPADATTPADEINENSPAGSVVVAAGQRTIVSSDGSMEKPSDVAKKDAKKETAVVQTAAESETGATDASIGANEAAVSKYGALIFETELVE